MIACPKCKTENSDDAQYCHACGQPFFVENQNIRTKNGAISQGKNNQTVSKDGLLVDGNVGGNVIVVKGGGRVTIGERGVMDEKQPKAIKNRGEAMVEAPVPSAKTPVTLVIGSGVAEKLLRVAGEFRLASKQNVSEYKELYGGSGINYTFRLGHAGYPVLPILSVGNDWLGHKIQQAIARLAKHGQIARFIQEEDFCCEQLFTPESIVLVTGERRTILTGNLKGFQFFKEFLDKRLEQVQQLDQLDVKAVMIGHIYADGTEFNPGNEGSVTRELIEKYAEQEVIVFTNFGRSQFKLGNKFWEPILPKITFFQLALDEAREFFSQDRRVKSLRDMLNWFQDREITAIITMDKVGAVASLKDGSQGVIFARPYDLGERFVDSTGAGDAFGAGLISYFLDMMSRNELGIQPSKQKALDQYLTIGNFEDALERGRHWAAYCCTKLGAANECPDKKALEGFRTYLKSVEKALVKRGDLNDFDDVMWFIDKAY
jgi:sugar/nucleoside kinase (ribokinase family)